VNLFTGGVFYSPASTLFIQYQMIGRLVNDESEMMWMETATA